MNEPPSNAPSNEGAEPSPMPGRRITPEEQAQPPTVWEAYEMAARELGSPWLLTAASRRDCWACRDFGGVPIPIVKGADWTTVLICGAHREQLARRVGRWGGPTTYEAERRERDGRRPTNLIQSLHAVSSGGPLDLSEQIAAAARNGVPFR